MKEQAYYYFISGLPDIAPDDSATPYTFINFFNEAREQLTPEDYAILEIVRYPYNDNNLIRLLYDDKPMYDPRGSLTQSQLDESREYRDGLPDYLCHFLSLREKTDKFIAAEKLKILRLIEQLKHPYPYIHSWTQFELNLQHSLKERFLIEFPDLSAHLGQAFDLDAIDPLSFETETFSSEHLYRQDLPNAKAWHKQIKQLRWTMSEQYIQGHAFSLDHLLCYALRLSYLEPAEQDKEQQLQKLKNFTPLLGVS